MAIGTETKNMTIEMKKKFGVSFHKNMSLSDMSKIWLTKVPPNIQSQYKELTTMFISAKAALDAKEIKDKFYESMKQAKDIQTEITITAASLNPVSPNPAQVGAVAAELAAKLASEAEKLVIEQLTNLALNAIDKISIPETSKISNDIDIPESPL
jgi:hypothetical protein